MAECTQGNLGLSVTVIDTCGLPVIRENSGRGHVIPLLVAVPEVGYAGTGAVGVVVRKSKGTGV